MGFLLTVVVVLGLIAWKISGEVIKRKDKK
jgi:hypothetical protein